MSKRILILGGHGFIGSHTANILRNQGHTIGVVDCYHRYYTFPQEEYECVLKQRQDHCGADSVYPGQIEDAVFMENTFKSFQPNIVIHVATYPNAYMVKRNVIDATSNMVTATAVTLDLCVEHNVERVVFASSSMVYGDFKDGTKEDAKTKPKNIYGEAKLTGERMVKLFAKRDGLNYAIVRPSGVYGPGDMPDRVVSKFFDKAMKNETITLHNGNNKVDFTYREDTAAGIVKASLSPVSNVSFNITQGQATSLLTLAEKIIDITDSKSDIEDIGDHVLYPSRGTLDISRAKDLIDYKPEYTLDEGLKSYYEWLRQYSG